ncbi:MAG: lactate utilization protein [Oscillospiraceae bacterium]|nr:lactate utilization protein [Oscillospiraceae bacterium]
MDNNLTKTIKKRIDFAVEALRKNRFEAHYIPTNEELLSRVSELIPPGCTCSTGGSVTLTETGIRQYLESSSNFTYFDRFAPGIDLDEVNRKALTCDIYLSSTNAITLDGKLYNMDGRANRVAAICYGPKKLIIVAGYNKIVTDISAARLRNREICAPANALRLGYKVPCGAAGICQDCKADQRMCSQELITGWQSVPGRICVFILGEQYGY